MWIVLDPTLRVLACQLSFGSVTPRAGPSKLAWGAADHVLTGFGASLLEEIIFRGLILRIFYTATRRPWLAILLQSLFFAYVHFKIPPSAAIYTEGGSLWSVSFFSAYWLLAGIATNFDPKPVLLARTARDGAWHSRSGLGRFGPP